jgi:hypothetical protein
MTTTAPIALNMPWLQQFAATQPPCLSDRMIHALEAHASTEVHDLATCEQLAQGSADPVTNLLLGMIVDDGHRHQALLQSMVRRLQQEVEFVDSPTALPVPHGNPAPADSGTVATLRSLIREEHESARHLRHVSRQEPGLYGGLFPVLLETIARDAEKHATILRYLLGRMEDAER